MNTGAWGANTGRQVTAAGLLLADRFNPNTSFTHIVVLDPRVCHGCQARLCVKICPSGVFEELPNPLAGVPDIVVRYDRCLECAACHLICPENNLFFDYPSGGFGITYVYG